MINVMKEVQAMANMAGTVGLKVELLPHGDDQPRTCMVDKILYLPRPLHNWSNLEIMRWRGSAWHEVGHHHVSQAPLLQAMEDQQIGYNSPLGFAINAIDDVWQEMVTAKEYSGAGRMLDASQGEGVEQSIANIKAADIEDFPQWMVTSMMLAYDSRREWQLEVDKNYHSLEKLAGANPLPHLVDRVNNVINHTNPAQEVIDIAKEIVESDGIDPDSEEGKGKPQPDNSEGDEESGEGPGEGKSEESDEEGQEYAAAMKALYEDLMGHSHGDPNDPTKNNPLIIEYSHTPRWDYIPYTADKFDTSHPDISDALNPRLAGYIDALYESTAGVGGRIARLFQTAAQTGREFQQKRGKLTGKHLTRGAMGDPRIFNRKSERLDNKAEITFLCDCSGSMSGDKYKSMTVAVGQLSAALNIAGVPHKVVGFTEWYEGPENRVIKGFDEPFTWDTFRDRFASMDLAQNADGDHLMYEYNDMLSRDAKRKIIIVLSDGRPCCSNSGDADTYLQEVTKEIQGKGLVELYGIGIMSDAVERYYKDHVVLHSPNDIEECITNVVKEKIIKGA